MRIAMRSTAGRKPDAAKSAGESKAQRVLIFSARRLPTGLHGRKQRGFSLVEILVALLVLSLGLLGTAALLSTSLRSSNSAYLRTQAALYAYDMLDRMRANREAARAGRYNLALEDAAPTCNPVAYNLVDCDRAEWRADVASLPAGTGAIGYDPNTQLATVVVQWNDERAGGSTTASVTIQSQL